VLVLSKKKQVFLLLLSSFTGNYDDFNLQDAFGNYYTFANFEREVGK